MFVALKYSSASNCLASCGRDSVIKIWNCETLQGEARERRRDDTGITCQLVNNLEGHRGDVVSIAWSETGATLVSGAHLTNPPLLVTPRSRVSDRRAWVDRCAG